jgi:hypothetical protein
LAPVIVTQKIVPSMIAMIGSPKTGDVTMRSIR